MTYTSISSQRSMTLDLRRNEYYYNALKQVITPESIVLDLGAGLGVHGFLAAKLGAKQVYMVEPEDVIIVTKQIAKANGLEEKIQFFQGRIEDIELPGQVDVIISVFTGNFLLTEDLLPSLFYARDRYLAPNGKLIPDWAVMVAAPVFLPDFYHKVIESWSEPHLEIDFNPGRKYAGNIVYYRREELETAQYLADPAHLLEVDFLTAEDVHCDTEVTFTIIESGLCHGWVGWFDLKLGDQRLSTSPNEPKLHWTPVFLPLDPPIEVEKEEELQFRLLRPPKGEWSWFGGTGGVEQKHSTFLASSISLETVKKTSLGYQPQLGEDGQLFQFILSQMDGRQTAQQIADRVFAKYPNKYTIEEARKRVQKIIISYG